MLADAYGGEDQRRRFQAEAEAVARLHHPNIVQVFEVGDAEGRAFCALEYVEGGTLAEALSGGPCAPRVAAGRAARLADAVAAAHERGVVHRDLKPANVLLASGGREPPVGPPATGDLRPPLAECVPKIADFGLAKRLDAPGLTQTGAVIGTPSYMAP